MLAYVEPGALVSFSFCKQTFWSHSANGTHRARVQMSVSGPQCKCNDFLMSRTLCLGLVFGPVALKLRLMA